MLREKSGHQRRVAGDLGPVEAEALARNQEALLAQRALEALVPMMTEFARGFDKVGSITVLGGEGASSHIAAESASGMRATFDAVEAATGIDLRQIIQGQATGRGVAQGIRSEASASRRGAAAADPAEGLRRAEEIGAAFAAESHSTEA